MAPADRERFQLVIALGEGEEGQKIRETFDDYARKAGKPVSVWAREILQDAVGGGPIDPIAEVTRVQDRMNFSINLRAVDGMFSENSKVAYAMVAGEWHKLAVRDADELIARWKRVHRST